MKHMDDFDEDTCDHEDVDFDVLTGHESCSCGWSRWLTSEEYQRRAKVESELHENFRLHVEKYERESVIAEICLPPFKGEISDGVPF